MINYKEVTSAVSREIDFPRNRESRALFLDPRWLRNFKIYLEKSRKSEISREILENKKPKNGK